MQYCLQPKESKESFQWHRKSHICIVPNESHLAPIVNWTKEPCSISFTQGIYAYHSKGEIWSGLAYTGVTKPVHMVALDTIRTPRQWKGFFFFLISIAQESSSTGCPCIFNQPKNLFEMTSCINVISILNAPFSTPSLSNKDQPRPAALSPDSKHFS